MTQAGLLEMKSWAENSKHVEKTLHLEEIEMHYAMRLFGAGIPLYHSIAPATLHQTEIGLRQQNEMCPPSNLLL